MRYKDNYSNEQTFYYKPNWKGVRKMDYKDKKTPHAVMLSQNDIKRINALCRALDVPTNSAMLRKLAGDEYDKLVASGKITPPQEA